MPQFMQNRFLFQYCTPNTIYTITSLDSFWSGVKVNMPKIANLLRDFIPISNKSNPTYMLAFSIFHPIYLFHYSFLRWLTVDPVLLLWISKHLFCTPPNVFQKKSGALQVIVICKKLGFRYLYTKVLRTVFQCVLSLFDREREYDRFYVLYS